MIRICKIIYLYLLYLLIIQTRNKITKPGGRDTLKSKQWILSLLLHVNTAVGVLPYPLALLVSMLLHHHCWLPTTHQHLSVKGLSLAADRLGKLVLGYLIFPGAEPWMEKY